MENKTNKEIEDRYKKYRQCLQKLIRYSKNSFYSNLCTKHKSNSKKLWSIINSILKKTSDKTSVIDCLEIDNILVYDSNKIANELGKYFANVGELYAKSTKSSQKDVEFHNSKIIESSLTFLHPTDTNEISKLIDSLKAKKSTGEDSISNILIKGIKDGLVIPLTLVINKSLQEGHFPSRMKIADVVPLYKSKKAL